MSAVFRSAGAKSAADQRRELRRRHRLRAEKSLPGGAAFARDRGALLLALDTFGNHLEVQRLRHGEDAAQHREVARILGYALDHAAVELERVYRQALEVVEI